MLTECQPRLVGVWRGGRDAGYIQSPESEDPGSRFAGESSARAAHLAHGEQWDERGDNERVGGELAASISHSSNNCKNQTHTYIAYKNSFYCLSLKKLLSLKSK